MNIGGIVAANFNRNLEVISNLGWKNHLLCLVHAGTRADIYPQEEDQPIPLQQTMVALAQ
jgi:hypothetical protein